MKTILRILGGLAVLVLLAAVVSLLFPSTYRVERGTVINARAETVFAQFGDLKAWKNWSAWHERDPAMKLSYSDQGGGIGAWSAWESATEGNGKMTLTGYEPGRKVVYKLEFPDMNMVSSGAMEMQPEGQGVRVAWVSEGQLGMNPIHRWFGLFMEKFIGPDFERGLANLKRVAETGK